MSKIDLNKGEYSKVISKAKKVFSYEELNILFARDLSKHTTKNTNKFDLSVCKTFEENSIEDTVVEKGLFDE